MSCTLTTISSISSVEKLCTILNPSSEEDDGGTLVDDSFDWNWEEESPAKEPPKSQTQSWLSDSILSLSPVEDLLVIAKKETAIFLARKWNSSADLNAKGVYEVVFSGSLCSNDKKVPPKSPAVQETISSVLCIPLASQQRSSQGMPDWTCVVVGYTSGYIRIYVQSGVEILSQFLHDDAVVDLKLRTKLGIKRPEETNEQVEELLIFYNKAIVIIDGFSLYQSLRACRNQLARAQASGGNEAVQPPPLAYRKWILQSQKEASGVANCGLVTPCLFDRLQSASFLGGFHASVKGSAPAFNHYLTSGSDPFIGVYEAVEGVSPALLSDVAFQVASKLTTAVFSKLTVASLTVASGWLGIGRTQLQSDEKNSGKKNVEKGTNLASRFGLQDRRRRALTITIAPIRNLCVSTDDFGRVLLIETFTGSVIRMWKGYRDAQCGWLLSQEEQDQEPRNGNRDPDPEHRRKALFLVIYGPRRGILEIWLTEQGHRVGAFNVGKDCRLIYQGYTVLGRTPGNEDHSSFIDSHQCFLLKSNGELKDIQVPFHCSLSVSHSLKARDAHLMKRLTTILDKGFSSYENERLKEISKSLLSIVQEICVPASQLKATQLVISNEHVSPEFLKLFLKEVAIFSLKNETSTEKEDLEYEAGRHALATFCHGLIELVNTYTQLLKLNATKGGPDSACGETEDRLKVFANLLHVSVTEAKGFLTSIDNYVAKCLNKGKSRRKRLSISDLLTVSEFIACFEMPTHLEGMSDNPGTSKARHWRLLKSALSKEKILLFGSFLFEDAITGVIPISKLTLLLDSLNVPARQLIDLAVKLTESEEGACIMELPCIKRLHSLISSISSLPGGPTDETFDFSDEDESWWDSVRDILSSYGSTGQALVTALVCRSVAMESLVSAQKLKEASTDAELSKEGWEPVTVDMEVWNLLVHRLDDLVALDCFVHTNHTTDESCTRALSSWLVTDEEREALVLEGKKRQMHGAHSRPSRSIALLSVQGLLENGHGAVAQLVASCLAHQAVPGPCLGRLKKASEKEQTEKGGTKNKLVREDAPEDDGAENEEHNLLKDVKSLRRRFPYSLEQDILWVHCCWECIMLWKEDIEEVPLLYSALLHLSCIHCAVLKQGLGHMMWKTVYKEIVISLTGLMEKVGKAPKERLCRKTVGLTYNALEKFLATGQKLLEIMSEESNFENEYCPAFREEDSWQRHSRSHRSIEEQAVEEPSPDPLTLQYFWSLVVILRLSLVISVRGFRPLSMYDSKGKQMLTMSLSSSNPSNSTANEETMDLRHKFCSTVLSSLVKRQTSSKMDEEVASCLHLTEVIWKLAYYFTLEDDSLRSHYAISLYSAGLDGMGYEASLLVHQKEAMAQKLLQIAGARLAIYILEGGDTDSLTDAISSLPTHITSWLQTQDASVLQCKDVQFTQTLQLLVHIVPYFAAESKERKFTQELIENLKLLRQS